MKRKRKKNSKHAESIGLFIGNREATFTRDPEALANAVMLIERAVAFWEDEIEKLQPYMEEASRAVAQKLTGQPELKMRMLTYFFDRIIHGMHSTLLLTRDSPTYCYVDMASVNRANLELAVNYMALLQEEGHELMASFLWSGFESDRKVASELKEWAKHPDPGYSATAKPMWKDRARTRERDVRQLVRKLGVENPGRVPNIRERFHLAGERWRFLYTSRYRQLCGWSHFHPEEVGFSPGNRTDFGYELVGVDRGLEMLHFSVHLVYLLIDDSLTACGKSTEKLSKTYQSLMTKFCEIVHVRLDEGYQTQGESPKESE